MNSMFKAFKMIWAILRMPNGKSALNGVGRLHSFAQPDILKA